MDAQFLSRTYTSADGLALHYRDYPGPSAPRLTVPRLTVLCLHGLTRNARDFEDLAAHLAQRYRVICPDLRGRGASAFAPDPMTYVPPVYVGDVAAALDAAGVREVALIGTSLGGIIGMIMAAVMPHRLLGVVLNDIGPELDAAGVARIGRYVGKGTTAATWEEAATAIRALDGPIFPDFREEDWIKTARRRYAAGADGRLRPDYDPDIAKPFARNLAPVDLWPSFRALARIPTLAIRGATSDLLSAEVFVRMKRELPSLEQVVIPDRGHAPTLDEPAAIVAIDAFLARLPPRLGLVARLQGRIKAWAFATQMKRASKS